MYRYEHLGNVLPNGCFFNKLGAIRTIERKFFLVSREKLIKLKHLLCEIAHKRTSFRYIFADSKTERRQYNVLFNRTGNS